MPLLKQEVFLLGETPEDLSPDEMVFQVRFTKEIYRDYDEYVKRMNLYRQKIWTCKATGRGGMTYERALVSECRAAQKSEFPKEFMGPVLLLVQFSPLQIDELVEKILTSLSGRYVVGEQISGVKDNVLHRCKILQVPLEEENEEKKQEDREEDEEEEEGKGFNYGVGWLDSDGRVTTKSFEHPSVLMKRNLPFTREALRKFIQESTYGDEIPWQVRDKLTRKFKIPCDPPGEAKQVHARLDPTQRQVNQAYFDESLQDEEYSASRKRSKRKENKSRKDSRKYDGYSSPSDDLVDDSLLEPVPGDPTRPPPCSEFPVDSGCVGLLLMVWDFCNSFAKLLQLSHFSLFDLEKALLYTEGESPLLSETYFSVFRLLLGEPGVKQRLAQRRKRKVLLSMETWKYDLCDYLELEGPPRLRGYLQVFRRECYSKLGVPPKLEIFEELIERAISTAAFRGQIDRNAEEFDTLSAQRRAEGLPISMRKGSRNHEKTRAFAAAGSDERNGGSPGDVAECKPKECLHDDGCLIGWLKKGKRKRVGSSEENGVKREYSARCLFFNSARQTLFKCNRVELHDERSEKEKAEALLQKRLEHLDREIESCAVRMEPLGKDREHNRYWFFQKDGRVFVESADSKHWSFYGSKAEFDGFYESLNQRGAREKALHDQIESAYNKISSAMQKRCKDIAQRTALEEANIRRSLRVQSAPRPQGFLAYVNKKRI